MAVKGSTTKGLSEQECQDVSASHTACPKCGERLRVLGMCTPHPSQGPSALRPIWLSTCSRMHWYGKALKPWAFSVVGVPRAVFQAAGVLDSP